MEIELSMVATGLSAVVAGYVTLARIAFNAREGEVNRRLDDLRQGLEQLRLAVQSDVKSFQDRLHTEEKATIRQDGEVARVWQAHSDIKSDIDDMKRMLEKILATIRPPSGGGSSGGYSAAMVPRADPRKEK